jgi:serine/threonine protein kinase/tetratricopeptide (TPR) repeat protein
MPKSRVTSERWTQIEELFHRAAECAPEHRAAMLDDYCGADAELRRQVEALLSSDESAGDSVQAAVRDGLDDVRFPLTGETISHYHILDGLGGGGMGLVYRAEDIRLGRRVALKFLPDESVKDPAALGRFEREARSASALEHPNICPIYEFGEHEGQPFLVMQLLEGQTLRELISAAGPGEPPLELNRLLELAIQIVDGLDAAHQKGIIHRDIKPANIFITREGQAKILDFGLAKLAGMLSADVNDSAQDPRGDGDAERTLVGAGPLSTPDLFLSRTGMAMGTAGYMSPEQVRGEKLDARSDLFSFGLVLYEMATGKRAFAGDTGPELQEAILTRSQIPARELNPRLPAMLETIINRVLEKNRERRYQSAAEIRADLATTKTETIVGQDASPPVRRWSWVFAAAVVIVGLAVGGIYWGRSHKVAALTERDALVLGDFTNTTGDLVFDDTLKQGLALQLEQSPFLDLVSDRKAIETLKLMGRPADERMTPTVTREVCLRTGSKAMVTGSIAGIGSQYQVDLKATNCNTGDVLAEAHEQAASKEAVLKALDRAAVSVRGKLGESLSSVQKYATPLEDATTPSLEALRAYSVGRKTAYVKGNGAALPYYKRALEMDPNFALGYRALSVVYGNLNEAGRSAENARKAYELRGKASERERFNIEAIYYTHATGELEKAAEVYEQWLQIYPRELVARGNLGVVSGALGNLEKALEQSRETMRLEPNNHQVYGNLAYYYTNVNRLDEADALYKQAEERKWENDYLTFYRYEWAFLMGDSALMARMAATAKGKQGIEDILLASQAQTEGWYGQLRDASEFTRQAMDAARRKDANEAAALYQATEALSEVESGNRVQARADAGAAVKLAPNRDVRAMAALTLARAGDTPAAEKLANEIDKAFPLDTLVQRYWLPTIRAALALQRQDPGRAVELLKAASPIELSVYSNLAIALCPVYLRGEAFLMLHDGNAAAAEFQKFIDHWGLVANAPWGALARLGLARSYAQAGDTVKSLAKYREFLALWKNADSDLRVLKEAKSEYKLLSARPVNADSHEAYLMGRFYWNKRTHEDIVTGLSYFQKAVSLDPKDPHGYAGIADSYIALGGTEWLPPGEAFSKAKEAALKALALDDTLAEAHSALGQAYQAERDWAAAEKECKRALALNPSYTMAHWRYSFFLSKVGRHDEAIAEAKRARELDPLLLFANVVLGQALYHARRYDESQQVLLKALEQEPSSYTASTVLASTYAQKGMFRESIAALERVPQSSSADVMIRAPLGYDYAKLGKNRDAEQLLKELGDESRRKYVSAYFVSWVCIGLGRNEEAIQWLEQAYRQEDYQLTWLGVEPIFDPLRSDPRFTALLRRLGLPPQASLKGP